MDIITQIVSVVGAFSAIIICLINNHSTKKRQQEEAQRALESELRAEERAKQRDLEQRKQLEETIKNTKDTMQNEAIMLLLWDRLDEVCHKCIDAGSRSEGENDRVYLMYKKYKELGGNGHMKKLMERFDELPFNNN